MLQSLITVASATSQSHQIDIEHLQTQHDHNNDSTAFNNNSDDDEHDVNDCHHCGHCSGSHFSWILISHINSITKPFNINNTPYKFDQSKEFLDAILRPPIS